MNAPILLAQLTGTSPQQSAPPRHVKIGKPQNGQAVGVHLDRQTQIDFSDIAAEKLTFVRIGERLIILFDNQSTVSIEPVFANDGAPLPGVSFEMAPGRILDGSEFAQLFPITSDPSVLPAAGTPGAPGVAAGANFGAYTIDPLATGTPLPLLGGEDFTLADTTDRPSATSVPIPGVIDTAVLNEDGLSAGRTGGPGDIGGTLTVFTGSLHIDFGTDVIGRSLIFAAAQPGLTGLTSGASPIHLAVLTIDGKPTLIGYIGSDPAIASNAVFTISLNAASTVEGSYTVTLLKPLDHPVSGTEDTLSLTVSIIAIDGSGDTAPVSLTISINDDSPDAMAVAATVVAEHVDAANAFVPSTATVALGISWGADDGNSSVDGGSTGTAANGDRSLVFAGSTLADLAALGLTSNGEAIGYQLSSSGTGIVATAGTGDDLRVVFTLSLSDAGTGSYTFTLLGSIDHGSAGAATRPLTFTIVATDGDGDPVTTDFTVSIADDAPTIVPPTAATVDEDGIGNAGDTYGDGRDAPGELLTASRSLGIHWGADAANASVDAGATGVPGDRSVTFAADIVTSLQAQHLTSNGVVLDYALSGNGTVLTAYRYDHVAAAYIDGEGHMTSDPALAVVFVVSLSDQADGSYTFTLAGNLDHAMADSEDDLGITFGFIATDSDGDSTTNSFSVVVNDDAPVMLDNTGVEAIYRAGAIDEEGLAGGNVDNSYGGDVPGATIVSHGQLGIVWGADHGNAIVDGGSSAPAAGDRAVVFAIQDAPDGLSSAGQAIHYALFDNGTLLVAYTGKAAPKSFDPEAAGADVVFYVSLSDQDDGAFDFHLLRPLDHNPDRVAESEGGTVTGGAGIEDSLDLQFGFVARDGDGDTIAGTFTVAVNDDSPLIDPSAIQNAGIDEETVSGIGGNVGDSFDGGDLDPDPGVDLGAGRVVTGNLGVAWGVDNANPTAGGGTHDLSLAFFGIANDTPVLTGGESILTSNGEVVRYHLTTLDGKPGLVGFVGEFNPENTSNWVFTVSLDDSADHGAFAFTALRNLDHPAGEAGANVENDLVLSFSFVATDADGDRSSVNSFAVTVNDDGPTIDTEAVADAYVDEDGLSGGIAGGLGDIPGEATSFTGSLGVSWGADRNNSGAADRSLSFDRIQEGGQVWVNSEVALTSDGQAVHYHQTQSVDGKPMLVGYVGEASAAGDPANWVFSITLDDSAADGSYTFELLRNVDHRSSGEDTLTLRVDFTATDSDGDSVSDYFRVRINDDSPEIGKTASVVADEDALLANEGHPSAVSGDLGISWGADNANGLGNVGIDVHAKVKGDRAVAFGQHAIDCLIERGLTSDGVDLTYVLSNNGTVLTAYAGTTHDAAHQIFAVALDDAGTGSYAFTLTGNLDHLSDIGENSAIALEFIFTAFDSDGDGTSSSFTVTVNDDVATVGTPYACGLVEEEEFVVVGAGNEDTTGTGDADHWGGFLGLHFFDVTTRTTGGGLAIAWGADDANTNNGGLGDRSVGFTAAGIAALEAQQLTSRGNEIHYKVLPVNGGEVLLAYTGAEPFCVPANTGEAIAAHIVFVVGLSDDGSGSYAFTLIDTIDHPGAIPGEDTLSLTFEFTATDSDGDITAPASFDVGVIDDTPIAIGTILTRAVEEEQLVGGNEDTSGPGDADKRLPIVGLLDLTTTQAGGPLNILWGGDDSNTRADGGFDGTQMAGDRSVAFGGSGGAYLADGTLDPAVVAQFVSVSGGYGALLLANLTSGGVALHYVLSGNGAVLTAYAGATCDAAHQVFTVALSDHGTGSYQFTLTGPLDHPVAGKSAAQEDALRFTFNFTARDGDGDIAGNSFTVAVIDDTPVTGKIADQTVTESTSTDSINQFQPQSLSDVALNIAWGADNANGGNGEPGDRAVAFAGALNNAVPGVTSNGYHLIYIVSADGQTLTAYRYENGHYLAGNGDDLGGLPTGSAADQAKVFAVTLSDAGSSWSYSFTLYDNLDQAPGGGANSLPLSFGFVATDSDGDTTPGSFTVRVVDDLPVRIGDADAGSIEEAALVGGSPPSTSGGIHIDWNSDDSHVRLTFTDSIVTDGKGQALVLSSGDVALDYTIRLAADGIDQELVAYKHGESDENPVFVVTLNAQGDASYTFALFQPLDHTSYDSTLPLTFNLTGYDGDNDPVSTTITVNVVDGVPNAPDATTPALVAEDAANPALSNVALAVDWGPDDGNDDSNHPFDRALGFANVSPTVVDQSGVTLPHPTSMGYGLQYVVSSDDTVLTAYRFDGSMYRDVDGNPLGSDLMSPGVAAAAAVFTLTLSDKSTGSYSFTLLAPLDHTAPTGTSQYLDLSFTYTASDADGDRDDGTFTVRVDAAGTIGSIHYDGLSTGVFVNLGDAAVTFDNQLVAGHTATDRAGGGGHLIGIDQMGPIAVAYGSGAADVLIGGDETNQLFGNAGDDVLIGGGGTDDLAGGDGADTMIYTVGDGSDTVDGGADGDTQIINGTAAAEAFTINAISLGGGSYVAANIGAAIEAATAVNFEVATTAVEEWTIKGGGGGDTFSVVGNLLGTGLAASTLTIDGGDGADTLDLSSYAGDVRVVSDGGAESDRVKFAFNYVDATYTKVFAQDGVTLIGVHVAHGGVIDTFTNYESFAFADGETLTLRQVFNLPPVIDLDADDSSGAIGTGYCTTTTGVAVKITDSDLVLTDRDSNYLEGASISLDNAKAGDHLNWGALPSGIQIVNSTATGVTIGGHATLADYAAFIRSVTFSTTSADATSRSITISVNDGEDSSSATATVAINHAPVITQATGGSLTEDAGYGPSGDNLLLNGGFEDRYSGWNARGYTLVNINGNTTHSGNNAMRLLNGTPSRQADGLIWQDFTAVPDQRYQLSYWVKPGSAAEFKVYINGLVVQSFSYTGSDAYEFHTYNFIARDTSIDVTFAVDTFATQNSNGVVVDDVSVDALAPSPVQNLSGTVTFTDVDVADTHTMAFVAQARGYLGTFTLDPVNQATDSALWHFTVDNADLQLLAANEIRTQNYAVTVSDGKGGTDTRNVTVTLNGANDVPIAHDDSGAMTENSAPTIFDVLGNDTLDPDGNVTNTVTVGSIVVGDPRFHSSDVAVSVTADNRIRVELIGANWDSIGVGYDVQISISYTVHGDQPGDTSSRSLRVTVNGVNDAPVGHDDRVQASEDTPLTINALLDLLNNDTDPDTVNIPDGRSVTGVANATHGTVSLNNGNPIFTPEANYSGVAGFDYTVSDGNGGSSTAHVTVDVAPKADAPLFTIAGGSGGTTPTATTHELVIAGGALKTSVAALVDGGFVVAWEANDGSGLGIFAQRYDAAHNPVGAAFRVNSDATNDQGAPTVAALPDGGFVVSWNGPSASGSGIFVQRFTAAGQAVGTEALILNDGSYQEASSIAGLAGGGYVIVWQSLDTLAGRVFSAAAVPGVTFSIPTNAATGLNAYPSVAALEGGGFVVTWAKQGSATGKDVVAQLFDSSAHAVGAVIAVNETLAGNQWKPQVASLRDGGFVIVWDGPDASSGGIYAQRYAANGVPVGHETLISTAPYAQGIASVVALADGGYMVMWNSYGQDGIDPSFIKSPGVYAQRVGADGTPIGGEIHVSESSAGIQAIDPASGGPTLVQLVNGDIITTWSGAPGNAGYVRAWAIDAAGREDTPINLPTIAAAVSDSDGSETLRLILSGYPSGATFSKGHAGDVAGTWVIDGAAEIAAVAATPLQMTPPANYNGTFILSVAVEVTDHALLTDGAHTDVATTTHTIIVDVTAVNDAPVANADTAGVLEDATLIVTAANGVIRGATGGSVADTDPDDASSSLVVSGVVAGTGAVVQGVGVGVSVAGSYGHLTLNADGSYSYVADAASVLAVGVSALDTFTYTDTDPSGAVSNTATLSITVTGVNHAPAFAAGATTGSVTEDETGRNLLSNGDFENYLGPSYWATAGTTYILNYGGSHGVVAMFNQTTDVPDTLTLTQTAATVVGQTYTLTFDLQGYYAQQGTYPYDPAVFKVSATGAADQIVSFVNDAAFHTYTYQFTATSASTVVTFSAVPFAYGAIYVDNVSLIGPYTGAETTSGSIAFTDADSSDIHSVTYAPAASNYYGLFKATVDDGNHSVNWTFTVDDSTIQSLHSSDHVDQTYILTIDDGHGGTTSRNVTVTINGADEPPTGTSKSIVLSEDVTRVLTLSDFGYADADGDAMASVTITSLAANTDVGVLYYGNVAVTAGLVISVADIAAGMLNFAPKDNAYSRGLGTVSVGFKVTDSTGMTDATERAMSFAFTNANLTDQTLSTSDSTGMIFENQGAPLSFKDNGGTDVLVVNNAASSALTALSFLRSDNNLELTWTNGVGTAYATVIDQYVSGNSVETLQFNNSTSYGGFALSGSYILAQSLSNTGLTGQRIIAGTEQSDNSTLTTASQTIAGGSGANIIFGNGGNDFIASGVVGDLLVGGLGSDTLVGYAGSDTYLFGLGDGFDTISENWNGSGGGGASDKIVIKTGGAAMSGLSAYDNDTSPTHGDLVIGFNGQQVTVSNHFWGGNAQIEFINFDNGTVYGYTLGANDYTVNVTDTASGLYRPVSVSAGSNFIAGELGDSNNISGGSGADLIFGGDQNDLISGGGGNNLIVGGRGNDSLSAGVGNDVYAFGLNDGFDTIADSGGATDAIFIDSNGAKLSNLSAYDDNTTNTAGNLVIQYNGQQLTVVDHFKASGANAIERISFDGGSVDGYDLGSDIITVRTNDPNGSPRAVDLSAFSSDNFVAGEYATANTITGGSGRDLVFGGGLVDVLSGGGGSDYLVGGAGNDTLSGNAGNDVLRGGAGADTFKFGSGESGAANLDRIVDFSSAEDDRIDLSALLGASAGAADSANIANYVHFAQSGSDLVLQVDTGGGGNFSGGNHDVATLAGLGVSGAYIINVVFNNHDHQIAVNV